MNKDISETHTRVFLNLLFSVFHRKRFLNRTNRLAHAIGIEEKISVILSVLLRFRCFAEVAELFGRIGLGGIEVCVEFGLRIVVCCDCGFIWFGSIGAFERFGGNFFGGEVAGCVDDEHVVEGEAGDLFVAEVFAEVAVCFGVACGESVLEEGFNSIGVCCHDSWKSIGGFGVDGIADWCLKSFEGETDFSPFRRLIVRDLAASFVK